MTTVVVLVVLAQGHTDERGRRRDGNGEKTRASVVAMCSVCIVIAFAFAFALATRGRRRGVGWNDDGGVDGKTRDVVTDRVGVGIDRERGEDDIESAAL